MNLGIISNVPPVVWTALLIFFARISDVSLGTFRLLLLVKGKRLMAASIGFCEVMIYMLVLSSIIGGGRTLSLIELIAYCAGYATGNFMGSTLEEKLISGYVTIEAITPITPDADEIVKKLRDEGYGTTVIRGEGRTGPKYVLKVVCCRKDVKTVEAILGEDSFITEFDIKGRLGGYFKQSLRKRK